MNSETIVPPSPPVQSSSPSDCDEKSAPSLTVSGSKPDERPHSREERQHGTAGKFASVTSEGRPDQRTSIALTIIAVLLSLHVVYFARTILMPIVAAVLLALLFRPLIRRFRRYRISDAVTAAFVLVFVVTVILGIVGNLIGPANQWLNDAPQSLRTVGKKLHVLRDRVDDLNRASQVVEDLAKGTLVEEESPETPYPFTPEEADDTSTMTDVVVDVEVAEASVASPSVAAAPVVPPANEREVIQAFDQTLDEPIEVQIQQPRLLARLQMLSSTGSILAEILMMLVLAYFLLASGDVLINSVLQTLPSRRERRSTVELVHSVEQGISSYLLTVTLINIGLGICIAFAMWLLGLPNPVLWGAMATIFNYVPFIGAICGTIIVAIVSILSFDSLGYALFPPLVFWLMTATEGNFITPQLLGRSMSLNPIMVFLSLSIWGWMWGIGGALLAVPILAVLKVGFDQFDRTKSLGTLLGDGSV